MTLRYTVDCDALGCSDSIELIVMEDDDLTEELENENWSVDTEAEDTHYCPDCTKKINQEGP